MRMQEGNLRGWRKKRTHSKLGIPNTKYILVFFLLTRPFIVSSFSPFHIYNIVLSFNSLLKIIFSLPVVTFITVPLTLFGPFHTTQTVNLVTTWHFYFQVPCFHMTWLNFSFNLFLLYFCKFYRLHFIYGKIKLHNCSVPYR